MIIKEKKLLIVTLLSVGFIHFMWIKTTVKWTAPVMFFFFFTLLSFISLYTLKHFSMKKKVMTMSVGIVFGIVNCLFAWVGSDFFYASHRLIVLWERWSQAPVDEMIFLLFTSTVTGCWVVSGVYALLCYWNLNTEKT